MRIKYERKKNKWLEKCLSAFFVIYTWLIIMENEKKNDDNVFEKNLYWD